ncbi:MAG TPA: hypothetical protein VM101_16320 [Flavitalea sp.]|nr:hypothetical protein [Flavitalea sp.]
MHTISLGILLRGAALFLTATIFTNCNQHIAANTESVLNTDTVKKSKGLANNYPKDISIENDPDVLYVEKFDDEISNIVSRYSDVYNAAGMSLDSDDVVDLPESKSLRMTNKGGQNTGGHLFKSFHSGLDSVIYFRYYIKYPSISKGFIHHQGIWFGGYNPVSDFPNPRAGICGLGNSRISIAYEPVNDRMGSYVYWGDMQSAPDGNCWGNDMVNGGLYFQNINWDKWTCVEIMIKLNNPVSSSNGELRIWQDGLEVGHWGPGFPTGNMEHGKFTAHANAEPFKGFRWRTDENLGINYIWIEFYDDKSPVDVSHYIKFDNLVVARKYIGPIKK